MSRTTTRLRTLLERKKLIIIPSAYDALTARMVQDAGFDAVYNGGFVTGGSTCISEPLLTMRDQVEVGQRLAGAVQIPLVMDAGAGWGDPIHTMRTVRECIRSGIAAIHLEDQVFPKRAHYHANVTRNISLDEYRDKIRFACEQRDELDKDFVIIARSDACRIQGYEEAIKRVNVGAEQGADLSMIFPRNHDEAVSAPKDADLPMVYVQSRGNRDERPLYTGAQLEDMGYAMVIDAVLAICVNFHFTRKVLQELKRSGDYGGLTQAEWVAARQGVEDIIGLEDYYRIERETVEKISREEQAAPACGEGARWALSAEGFAGRRLRWNGSLGAAAIQGYRVGVDVGGTFTDVVLPAADGSLHALKLLSSPDDYGRAIVAGVKELLESAGVDGAAVDELVHGTTVATNAVLEGTGAPTGLLTTRGFRDVLEIRRIRIPVRYDFAWEKPRPLVARERRLEVDERINARGEVERTLDPQQVRRTVEQLIERGAEALAVCLLNSYANPVHEREIGALLDRHFPAIPHTLSADVVPEIGEYERTSTTVINAYLLPLVRSYLGSVPDAMASILSAFRASVREGDVYLLNDPFDGGSHLPDIFVVKPLFCRGEHLGYAVTVAHHVDVGGRVPGSVAPDNTEIYQEGIRLGPVRLYDGGAANEPLFDVLERNVRIPEMLFGDLGAQIAACQIAQRGLAELEVHYGAAHLRDYARTLLNRTEQLTRLAIGKLAPGEYTFTDYIDDDGLGSGPLPIVVRVSISGDTVGFDFTGSAAQVRGAINATASYTKSASYLALKTALSDEIPTNSGFFRPIEVTVPRGSILNVAPPGACGNRGLTGHRAMDAVFGALAKVLPGAVRAAGEGGTTTYAFAGRRADGRSFSVRESLLGAWGGGRDLDGVDAISSPAANIANTPAEVLEAEYPLAVDAYALVPDSGGAGTHRGGLALTRELRYCGEQGSFYLRADRQRFPPYPLAGGCPGTPARVSLVRDGVERKLPAKVSAELRRGDVVRIVIPGAAGWGPPLNRDPQRVLAHVRSEKFSEPYARRVYGVVFAAKRRGGPERARAGSGGDQETAPAAAQAARAAARAGRAVNYTMNTARAG